MTVWQDDPEVTPGGQSYKQLLTHGTIIQEKTFQGKPNTGKMLKFLFFVCLWTIVCHGVPQLNMEAAKTFNIFSGDSTTENPEETTSMGPEETTTMEPEETTTMGTEETTTEEPEDDDDDDDEDEDD